VVNFLDLKIQINDEKCTIEIYDKTEDFNFEVVKFTDVSSNISEHISYAICYSQIIRYLRLCSHVKALFPRIGNLVRALKQKRFDVCKIWKTVLMIYERYGSLMLKFGIGCREDWLHQLLTHRVYAALMR